MIEIDDMRAFVEVAGSGGFTRAAQQLGIAKSMVSRRIAKLEKGLGVQLLRRTTRGVTVTADFGRSGHSFQQVADKRFAKWRTTGAIEFRLPGCCYG